jgi:hypothetical protein
MCVVPSALGAAAARVEVTSPGRRPRGGRPLPGLIVAYAPNLRPTARSGSFDVIEVLTVLVNFEMERKT